MTVISYPQAGAALFVPSSICEMFTCGVLLCTLNMQRNICIHVLCCFMYFIYFINIVYMYKLFFKCLVFQSEKNIKFNMPFVDTVNC